MKERRGEGMRKPKSWAKIKVLVDGSDQAMLKLSQQERQERQSRAGHQSEPVTFNRKVGPNSGEDVFVTGLDEG
jgi:hypothetical protein